MNWTEFNKIFKIDGIPLGYLLERLIVCGSVTRAFKAFKLGEIRRVPNSDLRTNMLLFALRKGFSINETIKSKLSVPKREDGDKRDVLFLAFTNQIFRDERDKLEFLGFNEVVNELKKRGKKPLVLVVDPVSRNSLFGLKKYDNVLYSYMDRGIFRESNRIARELHRTWENLDEKTKMKMFGIRGKRAWRGIKNKMEFLMSSEILSVIVRYYITSKKIIRNHNVSVVYLTDLNGFYELPLVAAAYKLDRAILYAPHGGGRIRMIMAREFVERITIAAWGEWHRKRLSGIGKEKVFVTGSPFLDKIARYRVKRPAKKKKTVLFITKAVYETPAIDKDEYFRYVRKFLRELNETEGVGKIILKLHPMEVGKYIRDYKKVIQSLGLDIEINQQLEKDTLYSLISNSDLLISYGSVVDVEGMMLDKNVINIEGLGISTTYKEAVYRIKRDEDLKTAVELVLYDKKTQREVKRKRENYIRSLARVDGGAYKRVANLVMSLIEKRRGKIKTVPFGSSKR